MQFQRDADAGVERCGIRFRDVDLGSEMWMQIQRYVDAGTERY